MKVYQAAEAAFLVSANTAIQVRWEHISRVYSAPMSANSKRKAFYAQQKYFEYGNQSNH